jgi:hypothetical protein
MSNEKKPEEAEKKDEEGLTEDELADVTGGAGAVVGNFKGMKTFTTTERLPGGASAIHIKSAFGALPGGGTRVIKQAGG